MLHAILLSILLLGLSSWRKSLIWTAQECFMLYFSQYYYLVWALEEKAWYELHKNAACYSSLNIIPWSERLKKKLDINCTRMLHAIVLSILFLGLIAWRKSLIWTAQECCMLYFSQYYSLVWALEEKAWYELHKNAVSYNSLNIIPWSERLKKKLDMNCTRMLHAIILSILFLGLSAWRKSLIWTAQECCMLYFSQYYSLVWSLEEKAWY